MTAVSKHLNTDVDGAFGLRTNSSDVTEKLTTPSGSLLKMIEYRRAVVKDAIEMADRTYAEYKTTDHIMDLVERLDRYYITGKTSVKE